MPDNLKKTFIAIDYGTKRIGLAKSDPMGIIASALTTIEIKSPKEALEKITEIIREYNPDGIVIGYPVLMSGDKSDKCLEIDNFIVKLKKYFNGPIHKVDEQYSSQEAENIIKAHGQKVNKDKKRVDRLSAVIILQRFLEETS